MNREPHDELIDALCLVLISPWLAVLFCVFAVLELVGLLCDVFE